MDRADEALLDAAARGLADGVETDRLHPALSVANAPLRPVTRPVLR